MQPRRRHGEVRSGVRAARLLLATVTTLAATLRAGTGPALLVLGRHSLCPRLSALARDRVAALHADALLRAILIDTHANARRLPFLWIDQHHVRGMDRRLHFDDGALLLG